MIKDNGLICELLTNGVLMLENEEVLNVVDSAIISLDTFKESTNDRKGLDLNKIKNDLLELEKGLRNKVTLRSVVSKMTEEEWPTIKEFAFNNGFGFMSSIFLPNNKEEIKNQPNICNIDLDLSVINFSGNFCGASYKEIAIDSDGTVYPCQALIDDSLSITNILSEKWYSELNNSVITNTFRNLTVNNIERCKECNIRYLCGGGCRAVPYNIYGGLDKYSECMCDYQKEIVKLRLIKILDSLEESEKDDKRTSKKQHRKHKKEMLHESN